MRILVTGASGMLGASLVLKLQEKYDVYSTGRIDFLRNKAKKFMEFNLLSTNYHQLMKWSNPDLIIHCAAMTDVDLCEMEKELAFNINAKSVKKFIEYSSNTQIIFISSDALFSNQTYKALEKDKVNPINIYGKSKERGENFILESKGHHTIIRTTIVGLNINAEKQGFAEWIINSILDKKDITLFTDSIFTPISIWHLIDELEWVLKNKLHGLYHIGGKESLSKYDFGFKLCKELGFDKNLVKKGLISDFKFKANRSSNQSLDSTKYEQISNRQLPDIDEIIKVIGQNYMNFKFSF